MSGYYYSEIRIKESAAPIDNLTKFAWADEDYETAQLWHEFTPEEEEENRQNEMRLLKQNLLDTDYVVIKIAEGVATKDDYKEILEQRKLWREQINELEGNDL